MDSAPRGGRERKEERDATRPHARKQSISAPHFPKPDPTFDFSKPYVAKESAEVVTAEAPATTEKRKTAKPVAALFRKMNKVDSGV